MIEEICRKLEVERINNMSDELVRRTGCSPEDARRVIHSQACKETSRLMKEAAASKRQQEETLRIEANEIVGEELRRLATELAIDPVKVSCPHP